MINLEKHRLPIMTRWSNLVYLIINYELYKYIYLIFNYLIQNYETPKEKNNRELDCIFIFLIMI